MMAVVIHEEQGLAVRADRALAAIHQAELDTQITTAKAYPRDVDQAKNQAMAMVISSKEIAQSCQYNVPRGKTIEGPSIRLAEIVANCWGNLRVQSRIVDITDTQVVAQCACMDMERNYGETVETRRSIIDKYKKKYNDDMITVTCQAAMSIAKRNAIFAVIPKAIIQEVYQCAITSLLDGAQTLEERREASFVYLDKQLGVDEKTILKFLDRKKASDISMNDVERLVAVVTAIKENKATVEEVFYPKDEEAVDPETGEIKSPTDALKGKMKAKEAKAAKKPEGGDENLFEGEGAGEK